MTLTFNTGRPYTAQGQIIEATIVSIEPCKGGMVYVTAEFNDLSRMIKGRITFLEFDDYRPTLHDVQREVMAAYDSGKYTNL